MKKFLLTVTVLTLAIFFAGCGGGGSKKSGLKDNEYLGSLPAVYADDQLATKADNEKLDKAKAKGDWNKLAKVAMKIDAEKKERRQKYDADWSAAMKKITEKEIPFSYSEAFKTKNIEVASLKISSGTTTLLADFVPKEDVVVNYKNRSDYLYIYFKAIAKDNSIIAKNYFYLDADGKYSKGQVLDKRPEGSPAILDIRRNPEKWANFARIEFITKEEYNNLNN